MKRDEAIERVVEAVEDMCAIAGKNAGMTTQGSRTALLSALRDLTDAVMEEAWDKFQPRLDK